MNPFIKLTGAGDGEIFHINILTIQTFHAHDDKDVLPAGNTCITDTIHEEKRIVVKETPEEIAAMIQKAQDEQLRMEFIKAALTGLCADSNRNIATICHESVAIKNMISALI